MPIRSRLRTNKHNYSGQDKEYFLEVKDPDSDGWIYHDWMTIRELMEIPECTIASPTLIARLRNGENSSFNSVEGCVFTPKMMNKSGNTIQRDYQRLNNWIYFNQLMPIGSLHKQAKIIQGKEFK